MMNNQQTPAARTRTGPSRKTKGRLAAGVAAVGLLGLGTALPVGATPSDEAARYRVTFTNTTSGQYLTPPNWAAHDNVVSVFALGSHATGGLQALAENGGVPVLAAELAGTIDGAGHGISGVAGSDPVPPGESRTVFIETDDRFLSAAAMLICTNDGFAGLDAKRLPNKVGQSVDHQLGAYDAGTELNTEDRSDLVPAPVCGDGEGAGASNPALAEDGRIHRHRGVAGVGDLDASYDFGANVADVSVTRIS